MPMSKVVPGEGIEPSWCCHRGILSPVRLPIPPSRPVRRSPEEAQKYNRPVHVSDFDYELPPELIAQHPAAERAASRLLHVDARGELHDRMFRDIVSLVDAKDLLVFNDTKVIKARLHGRKDSGGEVEILVERVVDPMRALAHVRASKSPKAGRQIRLERGGVVEVLGREGELFELLFLDGPVLDVLEAWGEVPLPPYITHSAESDDERRYQTVYARVPGAVAAPTAGLHFDVEIAGCAAREGCRARNAHAARGRGHVPAGSRRGRRAARDAFGVVFGEPRRRSRPCVRRRRAAGAWSRWGRPRCVRWNQRRPRASSSPAPPTRGSSSSPATASRWSSACSPTSTCRVRRCSCWSPRLPGAETIRRAYAHAIAQRYRFFSYGDAMLLEKTAFSVVRIVQARRSSARRSSMDGASGGGLERQLTRRRALEAFGGEREPGREGAQQRARPGGGEGGHGSAAVRRLRAVRCARAPGPGRWCGRGARRCAHRRDP